MAFTIPNENDSFNDNQSAVDSGDFQILIDGITLNGVISGLDVSYSSGRNVSIASGFVKIGDNELEKFNSTTVSISNNSNSNPRFSLIAIDNNGVITSINGSPDEFPSYPTIPDNSIILAAIFVPASNGSIASNRIVDKRVLINTIPEASTTERGIIKIATEEGTLDEDIDNEAISPSGLNSVFDNTLSIISNAQPPKLPNQNDYFININSPIVLFRRNEEFNLHADNGSAQGVAVTNYRVYVVDNVDDSVYVYDHQGNRQEGEEFDLDSSNNAATGIAVYNNRVYVGDINSNKIYVYDMDGDRQESEEFDLDSSNGDAQGIYVSNNLLSVVDGGDNHIYTYNIETKSRDTSTRDFALNSDNDDAKGIGITSDRIYVLDGTDNSIYVYDHSGIRQTSEEFDLDSSNINSTGLTLILDRLYILNAIISKQIFVYDFRGDRRFNAELFDLNSDNNNPSGIDIINDKIYIVDRSDDSIFVYDINGNYIDSESFDLHSNNGNAAGIALTSNRIYIVDNIDDRVYVYTYDGVRQDGNNFTTDEEFDLHSNNHNPSGIGITSDRIYVLDGTDNSIYGYDLDGTPTSSTGREFFDLRGSGVSIALDRIYIVNNIDDRVFVYDLRGIRQTSEEFDLDSANGNAQGIAIKDSKVYIVDSNDNNVYIYYLVQGNNKIWKRSCCNWDEVNNIDFKIWEVIE